MTRSFKFGSVKIANETIEAIARKASSEVSGVIEANTKSNKEAKNTKVSVINGFIIIDLNLVLNADVNVRKTIKNVQENVKRQVETMTGLKVKRVNVEVNSLVIQWIENNKEIGLSN